MREPPASLDRNDDGRTFEPPYDAKVSAQGYASVTGLVSTFAFAAVVLVFLIAATAIPKPTSPQKADMSFATILFAVGFLGCLLAAFQYAALAGAPKNVALTNSMLIALVVAVCLIAVLAGFESLAKAFLHSSASIFTLITVVAAAASPIFVFFPMFSYVREAQLRGSSDTTSSDEGTAARYGGWATKITESRMIKSHLHNSTNSDDERRVIALLFDMTVVATIAAIVAWVFHHTSLLGRPHQWLYYAVAILALAVVGYATVRALLLAAEPERKLTPNEARRLNMVQVALMFVVIAALP